MQSKERTIDHFSDFFKSKIDEKLQSRMAVLEMFRADMEEQREIEEFRKRMMAVSRGGGDEPKSS